MHAEKEEVMRSLDRRRIRLLAPLALALIAGLGALSLRAGDAFSLDSATTDLANPPLNVAESNRDANGNIKVHEQGTVAISGTVDIGNTPKVQDVNVTNTALAIKGGSTRLFFQEIDDFDKPVDFHVDISKYSKVRILAVVNGSGTVDFDFETNSGVYTFFDLDAGHSRSELLGEIAGTEMAIYLRDPDGEQVFVSVWGTN
jgi:hypothetical protein